METNEDYELSQKEDFEKKIKLLLQDRLFQEVIINGYINDTAVTVGSNFSGTDDEISTLKAISHLKTFLTIE